MPVGKFAFGTCAHSNFIYCVGGIKEVVQVDRGQTEPDSLDSCHAYNIFKDEWIELPNLPEGRIGPSLVVVG